MCSTDKASFITFLVGVALGYKPKKDVPLFWE